MLALARLSALPVLVPLTEKLIPAPLQLLLEVGQVPQQVLEALEKGWGLASVFLEA